ncbi:MAG: SPOR domain-containing protein [Bilophila sp.]
MPQKPFSSSPVPRSSASGDSGDRRLSGRKYTLSLSFSGLITSGIIMIIAVGWVFAFGVIVGRGYNPEKKLPELASLLPPPKGEVVEEPQHPILKAEELTFMKDLKQPGTTTAKVEAKPAAPVASAAPATVKKPEATPPKPVEVKERFNFVFQAVAYKNRDQAQSLRTKMEGEGLRTRLTIEKDGKGRPKWFRVQVLVRGTDADAATVKQTLASMGLKDATLASKTAVSKTAARKKR